MTWIEEEKKDWLLKKFETPKVMSPGSDYCEPVGAGVVSALTWVKSLIGFGDDRRKRTNSASVHIFYR